MLRSLVDRSLLLMCVLGSAFGCRSDAPPSSAPPSSQGEGEGATQMLEPQSMAAGTSIQPPAYPTDLHAEAHGRVPFTECPLAETAMFDDERPDQLLQVAAERYGAGAFGEAYACAEIAADLVPDSIDAHHIRAASAAALGHFDMARLAFSLALALDPEDPETLAAAADFYINALPARRRETTLLGLAYARNGRSRVVARRRKNQPLRARLSLLEAQAFNDLGRSDEALERTEEALDLTPDLVEALHERGVALFNLCRFELAREAFEEVLETLPDDPYAHHHLGLIYEQLGRDSESAHHLRRAQALQPQEFTSPVLLSAEEFRQEVQEAVAELPPDKAALLAQVEIEVADLPARADLMAVEPPFSPTILGLYRGLPEGVESLPGAAAVLSRTPLSRTIVLYRKNLARAVKTREELDAQIRRTLLHEIGHVRGLDEDALRRRGLD